MKTGCLFAFLSGVTLFVLALLFSFALDAVLPRPNEANFEGIGRLSGFVLMFVAPAAFIFGYRRQARREAQQPRPPENLRPIDYTQIGRTNQQPSEPNSNERSADN